MKLWLMTLLLTPLFGAAQPALVGHVIASGGGTSTGGLYRVRGTAGQTQAATVRGGSFSLATGFRAVFDITSPRLAPPLSIERLESGVRISWPLAAGDFVLEETESLDTVPVVWTVATYPHQTNGASLFIIMPFANTNSLLGVKGGANAGMQIPAKRVVKFRR